MKKSINLEEGKVSKLLLKLSIPIIIAQLINVLYNIVDRVFIGRMENGELAMAGVGVAFPIIIIISAFSALIGGGGAPLLAIKLGEDNRKDAKAILGNSFIALIFLSFFLTIVFLIFKVPILSVFGASAETINYANDYLGIYLIGTIFVLISLGLNSFINAQGYTKIGMTTVIIGAIINIVLDPIFIFVFDMGVKGAAFATIIGQGVSAIWVLKFMTKDSPIKLEKEILILDKNIIKRILSLGISPFIMQSTESLVIVCMNLQLLRFGGNLAVSSMTIINSIMQMILLPLVGLSQGAQPIISYNYGAKNIKRVKNTFKVLFMSAIFYTGIIWSLLMMNPELFVKVFNDNSELIKLTAWGIRLCFASVFILGAQIACQQTFLALGQAKMSLLLALLRKIILLIPLIYILPAIFTQNQLMITYFSESVANIIAAIITLICFIRFYKNSLSSIEESSKDVNIKIKAK